MERVALCLVAAVCGTGAFAQSDRAVAPEVWVDVLETCLSVARAEDPTLLGTDGLYREAPKDDGSVLAERAILPDGGVPTSEDQPIIYFLYDTAIVKATGFRNVFCDITMPGPDPEGRETIRETMRDWGARNGFDPEVEPSMVFLTRCDGPIQEVVTVHDPANMAEMKVLRMTGVKTCEGE
ncbi:hypothetical protein [Sagittula stellata]|uniref:Uncharacterized protein n=1 Tax=Sagittula stellata (strain ATCC 700073 / DSM 11524 / E-37) TaxID=388399 RepID=A3K3Y9_SAGS3|nr:hypothetical protein [Sagittula stellata]EBA08253.1 hypothetical protein SSE37_11934 [Sagittula stellata E-37]